MLGFNEENPRKRNYEKTEEFMPLSKSSIFQQKEGDDNREYSWGFKKIPKKSDQNRKNTAKTGEKKETEAAVDSIRRRDVYRSDDPLKMKEADKEIYLENLANIYKRNTVYIPSFCNVDLLKETEANMNLLIESDINRVLQEEYNRLDCLVNQFWQPLYDNYVKNERLSNNCGASKFIAKAVAEYKKAKNVYGSYLTDCAANEANYIEVTSTWKAKKVDNLTEIFKITVGDTLLKYKDNVNVPFEMMAKETNYDTFMKMVSEDIKIMRERVEKVAKKKRKKVEEEEDEEEVKEVCEEEELAVTEDRPVSREQMLNKALTPRRKKINKNPRLKHRMKYKKAVVRQSSQVPRLRQDHGNYQGEKNGIRIGVIKARQYK